MSSYTELSAKEIQRAIHDEEAFVVLFRHYTDRVFRFLWMRTRNTELAEDLTQETFIIVMKKLHTFTYTGAPFSSWLLQVALNVARAHFRKKGNTPTHSLDSALQLSAPNELVAEWIDLYAALDKLPEEERELLTLKYLDDVPVSEIAYILNISPNTCSVRIHRALSHLHTSV